MMNSFKYRASSRSRSGLWERICSSVPGRTTPRSPLPVILNVHGGGWVYGTKDVYLRYCLFLAQQGFAVVDMNYHLAPKKRFPLISAILWILQEQHTFENIGIVNLPGYAVFYYQQRSSVPDACRYNAQIEWPKRFFFPSQAKKTLFFNRAFPIFVTKLVYNCMSELKKPLFL